MEPFMCFSIMSEAELRMCIPVSHGRLTYGAALELLARFDPALARQVHDRDLHAPFTTGPLGGRAQKQKGVLRLDPDEIYRWRLTEITEPVSARLSRITPEMPPLPGTKGVSDRGPPLRRRPG